MTNISPEERSRLEAARNPDGRFGHRPRSAPDVELGAHDASVHDQAHEPLMARSALENRITLRSGTTVQLPYARTITDFMDESGARTVRVPVSVHSSAGLVIADIPVTREADGSLSTRMTAGWRGEQGGKDFLAAQEALAMVSEAAGQGNTSTFADFTRPAPPPVPKPVPAERIARFFAGLAQDLRDIRDA